MEPVKPEYAYVWHHIWYENDQRLLEVVGIFESMQAVREYNEKTFLAPLRALGHNPPDEWYQVLDAEFYTSIPPEEIGPGEYHQAVIRCRWNGGVDVGGGSLVAKT